MNDKLTVIVFIIIIVPIVAIVMNGEPVKTYEQVCREAGGVVVQFSGSLHSLNCWDNKVGGYIDIGKRYE